MNSIDYMYASLFNREKLPKHIDVLLPKVLHRMFLPYDEIDDFQGWVNRIFSTELEAKLKGSFFKLSSRSAKDISDNIFNTRKDLIDATEYSERWISDLIDAKRMKQGVYIYFLEKLDLDISREVRAYIYAGKIKGISVYDYMSKTHNLSAGFVNKLVDEINEKVLFPILSTQNSNEWDLLEFVIDACEMLDGSVQFIEVNPYFLSDPCCYKNYSEIGNPFFNETPKIPEYMKFLCIR